MGKLSDFILGGSKITAGGDCSHEIKRRLLLRRKVMTNLDSIFKSRDITWPTKVSSSQSYGFSCGHGLIAKNFKPKHVQIDSDDRGRLFSQPELFIWGGRGLSLIRI